jgi:predicted AlkP superfamily pyrophosphatase or phosphodiesterase
VKAKSMFVFTLFLAAAFSSQVYGQTSVPPTDALTGNISHVLLISIDGMHALDFTNCSAGVASINGGQSYCPHLAQLAQNGVIYPQAFTSRPSDSYPGLAAQLTGGTSRSHGLFYDVNYDCALSPPAQTTPYGIVGGANLCPGNVGTQVGLDEEIDVDYTKLDGGGGINPNYLPRDPNNNCAPVYPHSYIRTNTIFEVVRGAGGYTAWSDKHPAYEWVNGPSGQGLNEFYSPEINSVPVALTNVPGCSPLPDPGAATSSNAWTDSFQNIMCYDTLKVQAVLNWIAGKSFDGSTATKVPSVFGMNFQAVSVGQKLVEKSKSLTGGYLDAVGTPSPSLMSEIQYVDSSIGRMMSALEAQGIADSTLIIVSAKHGQSPIDPNRVLRIPADDSTKMAPSNVLGGLGTGLVGGGLVGQADEDDVSMLWLTDPTMIASAVITLQKNENVYGGGEIFVGPALSQLFNSPSIDSRTPDIIIAPNVGVTFTGGKAKISEHGGFSNDDRNVMLLVSNSRISPSIYTSQVETRQIAPTILQALGINPNLLQAVLQEKTQVLPGLDY